ncbi:adenylate/guanylate cyclase domain-containing protein [Ruegeria sp. 1NDH52C]|uniref:Adenylate/guanylate cyclase domain-containing protein n=1 Tax=Ruegeria alba TaxID=2916756 RepID=A0ABS9P287_9RHOB|nr:adenylate/guanylate cyclase domain-containing protein [Ruegeria alba]MCG6560607.1 adenylate/guanylate cyclase domain-containing protein [Ruegeria alba]
MKGDAEVTAAQPEFAYRLPRFVKCYLNFGLEGKVRREQRRQFMCNAIMLIYTIASIVHVVAFLSIDSSLWPASVTAFTIGFVFLISPFLYSAIPDLTVLGWSSVIGGLFTLQTFLIGNQSGMYLYMLLTPILWLPILGAERVWRVALVTFGAILLILICLNYADDPWLAVANYPAFARGMQVSAVAWTAGSMLIIGYLAFFRAETAEDALEAEHARSEALLYNLLPTEIAARLKDAPNQTIADNLDHTAILFADIVNFTPRSARMAPNDLVSFLNRIFSTFDELAAKHGLEKIKTIGDAYMVAAGLPQPVDRPVHRIAKMAFDMLATLRALSDELGEEIEIRIGLHTGPVVAGVIGHQKLFYDVWGDTVNTASRMESHGVPGRIQVTAAAKSELEGDYTFEPRGTVIIKGMGEVKTWWLLQKT